MKKEILQDLDGDDLTPPPCWIMTRLPPSAPPGPEAALMPDPGPGEVPAAAAALPPALPEVVEPPFGQPVTEASGQHFQDPAPTEPSMLYPPLQVSTDKRGRETLELSRDCALPESRRAGKRTDKRLTVLAAALGKSISGPRKTSTAPGTGESFSRAQGRPRANYSRTSVPGAELSATGRMNALRQGRKRKLPPLWGLLAWKLTRAARAQRYQVPESPW